MRRVADRVAARVMNPDLFAADPINMSMPGYRQASGSLGVREDDDALPRCWSSLVRSMGTEQSRSTLSALVHPMRVFHCASTRCMVG